MPYCNSCGGTYDMQHNCPSGHSWGFGQQQQIGWPGINQQQQQYGYNVPTYITDILNKLDILQKAIDELKKKV